MYKTGNGNKTNENNANLTDCLMAMAHVLCLTCTVYMITLKRKALGRSWVISLQTKYNIH